MASQDAKDYMGGYAERWASLQAGTVKPGGDLALKVSDSSMRHKGIIDADKDWLAIGGAA
jgi:SOS-response transcriptional repressor LexA